MGSTISAISTTSDDYQKQRHVEDFQFPKLFTLLGTRGSGKTHKIIDIVKSRGSDAFHRGIVLSEHLSDNDRNHYESISSQFPGGIEFITNVDDFEETITSLLKGDQRSINTFVVLDHLSRDVLDKLMMRQLASSGQCYNISTFIECQTMSDMSQSIRCNSSYTLLFRSKSHDEIRKWYNEFHKVIGLKTFDDFKNHLQEHQIDYQCVCIDQNKRNLI